MRQQTPAPGPANHLLPASRGAAVHADVAKPLDLVTRRRWPGPRRCTLTAWRKSAA
jgi:hypothetical protein